MEAVEKQTSDDIALTREELMTKMEMKREDAKTQREQMLMTTMMMFGNGCTNHNTSIVEGKWELLINNIFSLSVLIINILQSKC